MIEHNDFRGPVDDEINSLIKKASLSARDKQFDKAITFCKDAYEITKKSDLIYGKRLAKILPYFQKAGRYKEAEPYCRDVLIPLHNANIVRVAKHKHAKMKEWQFFLLLPVLFDKLRLAAKREGDKEDESRFIQEVQAYTVKCEELKDVADYEQRKEEYSTLKRAYESAKMSIDDAPELLRKRFKDFI